MHLFATQLRAEQDTTLSLRASQYKKKRKTGLQHSDDDDSSLSPPPQLSSQPGSTTQPHALPASLELDQLRVAGLLPNDEHAIPPAPFPHAPPKVSKDHHGPAKIHEEMAKAPARMFAVSAASASNSTTGRADATSLKKTHLNNVSTIMHRCLLEGDYQRAGRAWGMILRTQIAGGNPVDLRNHGRWGIGAEILLRRKAPPASVQTDEHEASGDVPSSIFSEEGFELAREYYERLIVEHPNRRTHPHTVDERTFYPAMFSLWIFEVCEKSKIARSKMQFKRQASSSSRSSSVDSSLEHNEDDAAAREENIRTEELAQALEIAERIDNLIVSPPFDQQTSLLQLRGHVGLWISDLLIGKISLDEDWDMDTSMESDIDVQIASEQLARLQNGQKELMNARDFFARAEATGKSHDRTTH